MNAGKNVTLVSPFRDSEDGITAYRNRVNMLDYPADNIRVIVVEGDSVDHTYSVLYNWTLEDPRVTLVKCTVNAPKWPSIVNEERFTQMATVFNAGLDAVDTKWSDYVMFVPSDVLFGPDLLRRLMKHDKDLIAPMFWVGEHNNRRFYDIWGFNYQGEAFRPYPPAWYAQNLPQEPLEMDTIGGVILMNINVLKLGCRYTPNHVDHGLCEMAKAEGLKVWCDPTTHIMHT